MLKACHAVFVRLIPVFLLFAGAAAPQSKAQTAVAQIVGAARPPYVVDRDGIASGPAVELVQLLARDVGIPPQVRIMPFQRAVRSLDQGDTIYPALLRTPARESKYVWIGEGFADQAVFYTRASAPVVDDLDSARQLKNISVMRGSELTALLQSFGLDTVEHNNSEIDNARLLRAGRIDGWFTLRAVGRATWRELGYAPSELRSGKSFAVMAFWIAASANLTPALIERLRAAYAKRRADGSYARIMVPLHEPLL